MEKIEKDKTQIIRSGRSNMDLSIVEKNGKQEIWENMKKINKRKSRGIPEEKRRIQTIGEVRRQNNSREKIEEIAIQLLCFWRDNIEASIVVKSSNCEKNENYRKKKDGRNYAIRAYPFSI